MKVLGIESGSFPHMEAFRERFILGWGGYPIVGTTTMLAQNLSGGLTEGKVFAREGEAVIGSAVNLSLGGVIKPMHGSLEEGGETHT